MSIIARMYGCGRHTGKLLIFAAIAIPAVIALLFIYYNGINAVSGDQWFVVPLFDKLYSGNLTAADLFAQHNEHRLLLLRLVSLTIGSITHYNTIAELYFSLFLICLQAIVLYMIFRLNPVLNRMSIAWFIPVTWLIFNLRQYDNLLLGFQMQFFLVTLFLFLSIYFLQSCKGVNWRFAAAILCSIAGTFSMANGLVIWPIGLLQLLLIYRSRPEIQKRQYLAMVFIWLAISIAIYVLYFYDYHKPAYHPDLFYFIQHPIESGTFLLALLGGFFSNDLYMAVGAGIGLVILYIYAGASILYNSKKQADSAPFLALILFTIGSAIMLTAGRAGAGIEGALARRYMTMTIVGVMGLYLALISLNLKFINPRSMIFRAIICVAVVAIFMIDKSLFTGVKTARITVDVQKIPYYTSTYMMQSDDILAKAGAVPVAVRQGCEVLKKYKLNVYSRPFISLIDLNISDNTTNCIIDSVNNWPVKDGELYTISDPAKDKSIIITGWAVDQPENKAAGGVWIDIDGRLQQPALYGIDRNDVAVYHKNANYRFSGFYASIDTSAIGPGRHVIAIDVVSNDKREFYRNVQLLDIEIK